MNVPLSDQERDALARGLMAASGREQLSDAEIRRAVRWVERVRTDFAMSELVIRGDMALRWDGEWKFSRPAVRRG